MNSTFNPLSLPSNFHYPSLKLNLILNLPRFLVQLSWYCISFIYQIFSMMIGQKLLILDNHFLPPLVVFSSVFTCIHIIKKWVTLHFSEISALHQSAFLLISASFWENDRLWPKSRVKWNQRHPKEETNY